jgi:hypothetical protein
MHTKDIEDNKTNKSQTAQNAIGKNRSKGRHREAKTYRYPC